MKKWLALLLVCAACGNPDNQVIGAIGSYNGAPAIYFDNIGSTIHGALNVTTNSGPHQVYAIILSTLPNLCGILQTNPNFFAAPTDRHATLVMTSMYNRVGTFVLNSGDPNAADVAYSGAYAALGPVDGGTSGGSGQSSFPVGAGYVAVTQFDTEAKGSFDLIFLAAQDNTAHELYGKYKTTACDLSKAVIPRP